MLLALYAFYLYTMKQRWMVGLGLTGVGVLFFSAISILVKQDPQKPTSEGVEIAMRQIGHELLLQAGDSTSRVMPVKRLSENTFQLAFQSSFTFVPDSLVKTVDVILSQSGISLPYIVQVRDCASNEVVYGFQIGKLDVTTLVPCMGREQALGCYTIHLSFLSEATSRGNQYYLYLLGLVGLGLLLVSGGKLFRGKKESAPEVIEGGVKIGSYLFLADRRMLHHAQQRIELSDKETKLMKIFVSQLNQPVTREQLMKEVWEDEGVVVGRSLDVFVSKLRKKLKHDPSVQLVNIHGRGYTLEVREVTTA